MYLSILTNVTFFCLINYMLYMWCRVGTMMKKIKQKVTHQNVPKKGKKKFKFTSAGETKWNDKKQVQKTPEH